MFNDILIDERIRNYQYDCDHLDNKTIWKKGAGRSINAIDDDEMVYYVSLRPTNIDW